MTFHEKLLSTLLVFSLICQASLTLTCRSGFEESPSATCLKLVHKSNGFDNVTEASDVCRVIGTYMARMLTDDDKKTMVNMIQNFNSGGNQNYAYAYLGGSDIITENDFVWTNGIPVDPSFWDIREPNDYQENGGEDCIVLKHTGKLNDIPCCTTWIKNVEIVMCEYDPSTSNQITNDDVFYNKCGVDNSTNRILTSPENASSPDVAAVTTELLLTDSANTSQESNALTDVSRYMPVTPVQESLSGDFNTSGQKGSNLPEMTEYLSTTLVFTSPVIGNSLYPTPGLDTTNKEDTSAKMYSSESVASPSKNEQNIGSTVNDGSVFSENTYVIDPTSLLHQESSTDPISVTTGTYTSIELISVTPTQRAEVTEISHYSSNTLSPVAVSQKAIPRIPQLRRQCPNKNQMQYKTEQKINILKVERKETQRFKRKLGCAPDDRMSSLIIGVASCLLLLIPFLFIVFTDLIRKQNVGDRRINKR